MSRGQGGNELTLWKIFWVILFELLIGTLFAKDHEYFLLFFLSLSFVFKKITHVLLDRLFSNGAFGDFDPFLNEWAHSGDFGLKLWWNCLAKVDGNTRSR